MELKGKTINFLGDSITEGAGIEDHLECRYDNVMLKKYGLKEVHNYGIGGTRLAYQTKISADCPQFDLYFCGRVWQMNPNTDIIVVYGGVNDYLHGDAPFGTEEDTTPATFCGAVNYLMKFFHDNYADKTVVFMTPAHCCVNGEWPDAQPSAGNSRPLSDYVDVIAKAAEKNHYPCLNLYKNPPFNPNLEEDRLKYTVDGLHPNAAGHAVLADVLADFIKSL